MKLRLVGYAIAAFLLALALKLPKPVQVSEPTPTPTPVAAITPSPSPAVDGLTEVLPSSAIALDMKYATADNFLGQKVYDSARCFLRPKTAERLQNAAQAAQAKGYQLKIFDCYRPLSIQKKMWALHPGSPYIADPAKGSKHNRGGAVDLTLSKDGVEVDMGTPFDDFSEKSHPDYSGVSEGVQANRKLLAEIMQGAGFIPISVEWWHFDDSEWQGYEVMDVQI